MASVAFGYLPILLFLIVALGLSAAFVVLPMIVARFTGAHQPDPQKLSEYECGFPAFEDSRAQFDVRFYLIAILFIVFDLEAAFLFPWAVSLGVTKLVGWIAMMIFLAELGLGLAYAWKKGALEWE
ncbi:NADH-quinone oxidoreductase subunit A [Sphingomonas sp. RG327]|uniref:NADH-quinone oxidoreductase subunit A n=1 Tax=Sphingomonas anseongensis TaxID=2908207 RepID=A0ABT0RCF4_9SPHN|nr:NADH-quinone oxidoreductase subunit A [Sphingomonas anseongensis]MCL6677944.1 NADH-quinone oxidoreductase subunit A [Sphingomonas anseongensis]